MKRNHPDISESADWIASPIDEDRREALRNDPNVLYHRNPNLSDQLEYEPAIRAAYPFDVKELYASDDDESGSTSE